jgi:hypothetical protein
VVDHEEAARFNTSPLVHLPLADWRRTSYRPVCRLSYGQIVYIMVLTIAVPMNYRSSRTFWILNFSSGGASRSIQGSYPAGHRVFMDIGVEGHFSDWVRRYVFINLFSDRPSS